MTLFFKEGSPLILLAILLWTAFILFFGGVGLALLREAMRREPRL